MTSYHIHPTTGTPAACRATQGRCPFGAAQEHYSSKDDARKAFEIQMQAESLNKQTFEPEVAEQVKALFEHHIAKTEDVDVKALLQHTQEELATASSVVKLNRTAALYHAATVDLMADDDQNLSKASETVAEVAELLKSYYTITRGSLHGLESKLSQPAKLKKELAKLKQLNFNLTVIEEGEGELVTGGHNATIITDYNDASVGEILRATPEDAVYYGEAKEAKLTQAKAEIDARALEIVQAFSVKGKFVPPKRAHKSEDTLPEGFTYLNSGAEANVYLHEATATVYKLPHDDSLSVVYDLEDPDATPADKRYALNSVVFKAAAAYEKVDRKALDEQIGAEYLPTYFLTLEDEAETPVGMIVQPYLDSSRYVEYDPTPSELFLDDESVGVSDVHRNNLRLDRKTGKLVLFDCLFEL
jgi:hypothetical protein